MFVLLYFGTFYEHLYHKDPKNFLFNSDASAAQLDRFRDDVRSSLPLKRFKKETLDLLLTRFSQKAEPVPKRCGFFPCLAYHIGDRSLEFSWEGTPNTPGYWQITCRDTAGRSLWDEPIGLDPLNLSPDALTLRTMTARLDERLARAIDQDSRLLAGQNDPRPIWSYWDFVYFSGITLTTVGFGDILPGTTKVRMLVLGESLLGVFMYIVVLNLVVAKNASK
jgi:hypothetical protein